MFLITHKGEAIAPASSMAMAKEFLSKFRHQPGTLSIIHVDNEMVSDYLDQQAMLAAERDWKDECYLQPHHD